MAALVELEGLPTHTHEPVLALHVPRAIPLHTAPVLLRPQARSLPGMKLTVAKRLVIVRPAASTTWTVAFWPYATLTLHVMSALLTTRAPRQGSGSQFDGRRTTVRKGSARASKRLPSTEMTRGTASPGGQLIVLGYADAGQPATAVITAGTTDGVACNVTAFGVESARRPSDALSRSDTVAGSVVDGERPHRPLRTTTTVDVARRFMDDALRSVAPLQDPPSDSSAAMLRTPRQPAGAIAATAAFAVMGCVSLQNVAPCAFFVHCPTNVVLTIDSGAHVATSVTSVILEVALIATGSEAMGRPRTANVALYSLPAARACDTLHAKKEVGDSGSRRDLVVTAPRFPLTRKVRLIVSVGIVVLKASMMVIRLHRVSGVTS